MPRRQAPWRRRTEDRRKGRVIFLSWVMEPAGTHPSGRAQEGRAGRPPDRKIRRPAVRRASWRSASSGAARAAKARSASALARKASRPPRCSTERSALAEMRSAHILVQRFRDQRHLDEVRQEPALGLVVGVAHIVAGQHRLAGQFTCRGTFFKYLQFICRAKATMPHQNRQARGFRRRPHGKSWRSIVAFGGGVKPRRPVESQLLRAVSSYPHNRRNLATIQLDVQLRRTSLWKTAMKVVGVVAALTLAATATEAPAAPADTPQSFRPNTPCPILASRSPGRVSNSSGSDSYSGSSGSALKRRPRRLSSTTRRAPHPFPGALPASSARPTPSVADYIERQEGKEDRISFANGNVVEDRQLAAAADSGEPTGCRSAPGNCRRVADPLVGVAHPSRQDLRSVCSRTVKAFDGEMRANLALSLRQSVGPSSVRRLSRARRSPAGAVRAGRRLSQRPQIAAIPVNRKPHRREVCSSSAKPAYMRRSKQRSAPKVGTVYDPRAAARSVTIGRAAPRIARFSRHLAQHATVRDSRVGMGRATLIGFSAVAMWALLALLTDASGKVPPFLLSAITFAIGTGVGLVAALFSPPPARARRKSRRRSG